jgi:hypothetical protein
MNAYDSPGLVASRLEHEISRSESRSHSQIAEVERRLTSRIHEIEKEAVRRSRWGFETGCVCLFVAWCAFILGIGMAHDSSRCNADASAAQARQSDGQRPDGQAPDGNSPQRGKAQ